ncbi:class 1 fructose-bisphosphatase [Marinibactrum halimedae]|uniref:Fructose-1,6-bisphosphatase class 1 n=1 Tax=Marinibactrum halimedae TaxID=1444977 RepID=A0AA37T4U7_9GAMM|nr:class 1 fructose-bisphosphatase [Marinibactrum halimedae]MCD9458976.1 class 1 fructose-bisphosphatase [Marinibactrum halimedae]GLS26895.1 fructose-1,6-bisphosphatase class 1 [Marinibactrum halimedae]
MKTLGQFLISHDEEKDLVLLLERIMLSCKEIAVQLREGALAGVLGSTDITNVQGETQKKLDIIANEVLKRNLLDLEMVAGIASEEEDLPVAGNHKGRYLVVFDPLDGSSNIDVNVSVGTIFSILEVQSNQDCSHPDAYLQRGRQQVAAGYVLYGPSATLCLTTGDGVHQFTLSDTGDFLLCQEHMQIPTSTQEFAINMSNQRFWEPETQHYVGDLLKGADGSREKNFNMRWIASMVADVHRVLTRGGIFMYPWDNRDPNKPGKLRLMYEGNPMSFLVEQAGGLSTTCYGDILDIEPKHIHQRVSVALGSKEEINTLMEYHASARDNTAAKLNT